MAGRLSRPIVTTVAPTTPVAAANSAPTSTTDSASPPRKDPNNCPIVVRSDSAMPDRSRITPMNTNSGTATSTGLVITPQNRLGRAANRAWSKAPIQMPTNPTRMARPPRVKATM